MTPQAKLVERHVSLYKDKFDSSYLPSWKRHAKIMSDLIKAIGVEEVEARQDAFFLDEDDFLYKGGFSIEQFRYRINQYAKTSSSIYRARVEAIKERKKLPERPHREPSKSEPKPLEELIREFARKTE